MRVTDAETGRPPYGAAAGAAVVVFLIYVATLAPSTAFWDTSEYIATAHILGIPHPPGNPLFVLLGRSWSVLLSPLGLSVAVRINLLAAATSAAASGFLFLVAHRIVAAFVGRGRLALAGAAAATLLGATAFTVWSQSTVNEKVYTISVLVIAAVTWLGVLWRDRHDAPGSDRYLLWALFLLALGSTNHLMSVLPAPALLLLVLMTDVGIATRPAAIGRAVVLVLLGLSMNFVLPVRAAQGPVIDEGDPTCETFVGAAAAIYTNGLAGCPMLADNLTRTQYRKPPLTDRQAPFGAQLTNYAQYFDWQWSRGVDASEQPGSARLAFTLLFATLGLLGLWVTLRADLALFAYFAALIGTLSLGLVFYLNFKYGYSLSPEIADRALHEVRERDYFFVASFLLWGMMSGVGLVWAWNHLAGLAAGAPRYRATSPVMLVAALPLVLNWSWASRAGDYAARDWAYDLLMSVEPYAVLFTNGDNDTFPLWYMQEVEGVRPDVTVIVGQYLFTSWYPKQLQRLTEPDRQRPFTDDRAPGLYEARAAPSDPVLSMAPDLMDRVAGVQLPQDLSVPFPTLVVTYPTGTVLDRSHQLALSIIHDSIDERPIYFASNGGLLAELGMTRWGVRHGLATKLVLRSMEREQPEGLVQGAPAYGGEWFDLERSLELYEDVYSYRGLRERAIWPDRSTDVIPLNFYLLALQLSEVARKSGISAERIMRLDTDAAAFRVVAQGGPRGTPGEAE